MSSTCIPKPAKIEQLLALVLKAANLRREDAAYDGRHDDSGAKTLENQVKFFNLGWDAAQSGSMNSVPPEWKEFEIQLDPEYAQYQKLKIKFGIR